MTTHTATIAAPVRSQARQRHPRRRPHRLRGHLGLHDPVLDLSPDAPVLRHLHHGCGGSSRSLNFQDFFTDAYYLKSLLNSLLLGVGTVITTSIIGIAFAFLLLRYDFPGAGALLVSHHPPDDHAAAGRGHGVCLHPGPGRNGQHHPDGLFRVHQARQLHVRHPGRAAGGNAAPVSAHDA